MPLNFAYDTRLEYGNNRAECAAVQLELEMDEHFLKEMFIIIDSKKDGMLRMKELSIKMKQAFINNGRRDSMATIPGL